MERNVIHKSNGRLPNSHHTITTALAFACALLICGIGCKVNKPWIMNPFSSTEKVTKLPPVPASLAGTQAGRAELPNSPGADETNGSNDRANESLSKPGWLASISTAKGSISNDGNSQKIQVSGVRQGLGPVMIAVFDSASEFPDRSKASKTIVVEATKPTVAGDLPVGELTEAAVAVFQDLNGDGILNRGSFGIPQEPYGFSNNAAGQMGPPSYEAARVSNLGKSGTAINIALN